jgi:hypothetical protein
MTNRRQLSPAEKQQVLERHGMRCFIDGHPIDSDDDLEFDHITPLAAGGVTELNNLAPVCRKHNRQKRTMSLSEYRDYLQLTAFFDGGTSKYLDDVLAAKVKRYGQRLQYEIDSTAERVTLYFDSGPKTLSLYQCPVTKWDYFYVLVPVEYLRNDKELQPRGLRVRSMWDLYRHFQRNTQLAPSICRFTELGELLLFDGQHKAAAQIWSGRKEVECKVYVRPNPKQLKETNLDAHQSYRQMPFYTHELMRKYADIFGEDWDAYLQLDGPKSERGFVEYLVNTKQMSHAAARGEVSKAIHWRILNDPENRMREFVSETTRTRSQPLTISRIQKTIFRDFLSAIPSAGSSRANPTFAMLKSGT